jgi:multidrug efflux pump subunit AcrA (membrane-fusion protein)
VAPATNGTAAPPAADKPALSLPRARRGRKGFGIVVALVVLVVVGAAGAWYAWFRGPQGRPDLVTVKVEYKNLQLKVVERGTLEAKENRDVKCDVKAGSRGAPKIKWVVDNGTFVGKGDTLVEIDDSYLQEQAQQKEIDRLNALKLKVQAEQAYPGKKSAITLTRQQLDKWVKGDFPQTLHDLEGQIQKAESVVLQQEDRTSWAGRMVKKGYMTASQAEAEQATLAGNKLDLQKLQEQKKVLIDYTDLVNRQNYQNAINDAIAAEQIARVEMEMTQATYKQQDTLYKDLQEQIKQCTVKAQYSGIVVLAVPEQTMRGAGSTQSIIAQGEPVQYGQKLMSIPDLSHMLVNVRVHEVFINNMKEKLPVEVRVDAAPGKVLKGHVKYVANVAAPLDWLSPDVKVYQAYVEIDEPSLADLRLKPGLSAVTTIYTELRAEHVLAVPVQTVMAAMDRGSKPRVYVMTPHGPEAREVEVGLSDTRWIEIKSGLNEGDEVIENPRALVSDKEKRVKQDDDKTMPTGGKSDGKDRTGKGWNGPGGKGKGKLGGPGLSPPGAPE